MGVSYRARGLINYLEQLEAIYLPQGHFDMWTGGAGDQPCD